MAAGWGFRNFIAQSPHTDVNYPHLVFSLCCLAPLLGEAQNDYLTGNKEPPTLAKAAIADGFINDKQPVGSNPSCESEDSGLLQKISTAAAIPGPGVFKQEFMEEEFKEVDKHQRPARSQSPV